MSHSSINDKLRQLAKDIQAGVDNSELVKAIAIPDEQHSIININNIDLRSCHDISGRLAPDPYSVERARLFRSRCIFVEPKHTGIQDGRKICDDLHKEFTGIDAAKAGCDYSVTKHTSWLVLQRLRHTLGKSFTASSLFETKAEAEMYASNFDNVVAIMPIEWEE